MKLTTAISTFMVSAAAMMPSMGHAAISLLPIPVNFTDSSSSQIFSKLALQALDVVNTTVSPRGNAYVGQEGVPGDTNGTITPKAIAFPVTRIVLGLSGKGGLLSQFLTSGAATGSAIYFSRTDPEDGATYGLTAANFTIDYVSKKVLADITPKGGKTFSQLPIYTFDTVQDKALKFKFPLSIMVNETLGNLRLTGSADEDALQVRGGFKEILYNTLKLPEYTIFALNIDYGTLVQDIKVKLRNRPISTRPYVAN